MDNVERLVKAGVITDKDLTEVGRAAINAIELTDDEIDALRSVQAKLGLEPLNLSDPDEPGAGIWRL
jgi:hypothetical protein